MEENRESLEAPATESAPMFPFLLALGVALEVVSTFEAVPVPKAVAVA
jgi:hypothetical protein